jgi:hypothetical protein
MIATEQANTVLEPWAVQELRGRFLGELIEPRASGYDEARKIWNGAADRRSRAVAGWRTSSRL